MIAQVRLKVWEAKSLVRVDWPAELMGAATVSRVDGAQLVLASSGSFTFTLADQARAINSGGYKAFEVQFKGGADSFGALETPSAVSCNYLLHACKAASYQVVEDWGYGFRAEVITSSMWPAGAHVRLNFPNHAAIVLTETWQATALTDPGTPTTIDFILGASPDGDGGFGFSATGLSSAATTPPSIECTFDGSTPTRTLPDAQALLQQAK